ncbi:protein GL2-INTERACTING REPRESSOR 2-like [Gossypium arboreum]|uniref:protein GL2-INTERACTING REPRESSOR 2-like n=1 Tax=Gossypium arboreum TaxID=29729 RepID=UPI0008191B16|nr:protein GL2-INTERACTING REPRESSOR 2-like [Gossypium arboreum]
MSGRENSPKLELKLNLLPPPTARPNNQQVNGSPNTSEMSLESSCVSSETDDSSTMMMQRRSSEEETPMVLVGCPLCLMYVMLAQVNPKCPKCKTTVFLDFLNHYNSKMPSN